MIKMRIASYLKSIWQGVLIFFLILSPMYFISQNIFLQARVSNLESRLYHIERQLDDDQRQTNDIRLYIKQTNSTLPALLVDRTAAAIAASAKRNGLDPFLLTSLARVESSFRPRAISYANAWGILQIQPATFAKVHSGSISDVIDNVEAGARYLKQLFNRFGDLRLAIAAYNCGPSRPRGEIVEISGEYADRVILCWQKLSETTGRL
jgi:soluble lytic murein transglycosylase-like protein